MGRLTNEATEGGGLDGGCERCPRCESVVRSSDMEWDPRWLDVCRDCHDELVTQHGAIDR